MSNGKRTSSRRELRRVLLVNTTDEAGGAERTARSIMDEFEEMGTEVRMLVRTKLTGDARVIQMSTSPHVDHRLGGNALARASARAYSRGERWLGLEGFAHPHSRVLLESAGDPPDLLLLMNLHGDYFDLRTLPSLSRRLPVVLRLCDSWLFTGHCASPPECARWESGCGACPDLAIPPAVTRDATRLNWHRKRRILGASRLAVTAPSQWLMERARRSILAPAIEHAKVVPNGLDLELFSPGPRGDARRLRGLDPDARILLFVAHEGRANPFKDFATLRGAMEILRSTGSDAERVELLVVGREGPLEILGDTVRIHHLARCASEALVELYRAADLYVHAAPEETFCNAAAESLACGLPVVAACEGGIREVVEQQRTGLHVTPGRPDELARALRSLLDDEPTRERMGIEAAARARTRFDGAANVAQLHEWCAQIASGWTPAAGTSAATSPPTAIRRAAATRR